MKLDCFVRIMIAAVLLAATRLAIGAAADATGPCAEKARRIDADIAQAKAKGNAQAVAKLERARSEMVHCSDDGLRAKRKMALEQAQHRIDRREADLKKAESIGDTAKVQKAQRSLESARKVYADIENSPL